MEQPNLYFIEVGTYSRAGNLTVSHSFAVSSPESANFVQEHFCKQYMGLGVQVKPIKQIELGITEQKQTGKSEAEIQIEKRVKELEAGIGKNFDYVQEYSDFSLEVREKHGELQKTRKAYMAEKEELLKMMSHEIFTKFGAVVKEIIVRESPDGGSDRYFKCTVCLKGKLY